MPIFIKILFINFTGISNLKRYFQDFQVPEGYLWSVDEMLRIKATHLTSLEKIVALEIDEIYLKSDISYDRGEDMIIGPHSKANVALIRGVFSPFKMPVW